jgi:DNA processing protein
MDAAVMTQTQTDADELPYWLALVRMPGIGPVTAQVLLDQWGTPRRVFEAGNAALGTVGRPCTPAKTYIKQPDWVTVERDLEWLARPHCHAITRHSEFYPALLKQIPDPPLMLFIQGDPRRLTDMQLAIVGSRNPTASGERTAAEFAHHLADIGLTITSGLAIGVDAAAHRGALASDGHTIAVTGTGLDQVYPARHRELASEIVGRGALVSEFPPGTPPRPENFPRRNRLISGMSLGTLVVEAAPQSGSLITARLAAEQGREVFAIPGSIHNPLARGCHALLRQGAKLVETAHDVLEELGALAAWEEIQSNAPAAQSSAAADSTEFVSLLGHIGFEPTSVDALVERSGLTADQVSSMLVVLELHGQVASAPGGLYTRIH